MDDQSYQPIGSTEDELRAGPVSSIPCAAQIYPCLSSAQDLSDLERSSRDGPGWPELYLDDTGWGYSWSSKS